MKYLKYLLLLLTITFGFLSFSQVGASSDNPFISQLETTASGGLSATSEIMATPIGGLIYFVIGMVVVLFFAGIIIGILSFAKGHSKH